LVVRVFFLLVFVVAEGRLFFFLRTRIVGHVLPRLRDFTVTGRRLVDVLVVKVRLTA
jgi:hypothetical protein